MILWSAQNPQNPCFVKTLDFEYLSSYLVSTGPWESIYASFMQNGVLLWKQQMDFGLQHSDFANLSVP